MVFSEFIDNITGLMSPEKQNMKVQLNESQAINELQQGMILLNNMILIIDYNYCDY